MKGVPVQRWRGFGVGLILLLVLAIGVCGWRKHQAAARERGCPLAPRVPRADAHGGLILSFSVWGSNEAYNYGMLENALLAPQVNPGSRVTVHADGASVDRRLLAALGSLPYVKIVDRPPRTVAKMCWRFLPCIEERCAVLVRDADSRIGVREADAVAQWLDETSADLHIIRDCLRGGHNAPMMGGTWGVRNHLLRDFGIHDLPSDGRWNEDQEWLWSNVYPRFIDRACVHDVGSSLKEKESFDFCFGDSGAHVGMVVDTAPLAFQFLGETPRVLQRQAMQQNATSEPERAAHSFRPSA
jgi:hypothetical protein